jgi:very-short-patch-repair endonuclease
MEIWKSGVIDKMTERLLITHNLKKIDTIEENGVVGNILESIDNKKRFIFTARSYMYYPHGDVISGINKKVVNESIKKNWRLLFGFLKEDLVYELNANTIAKLYENQTIENHNQILYKDISFKKINALNWNPARRRNMNKPETFITNLFIEHNLPIIYTGDGRFPISNLEPDWVCINKNKVIDFFGKYYHVNEDENKRREIFKNEGYEYLVIWEDEEKDSDRLLKKVKDFLNKE